MNCMEFRRSVEAEPSRRDAARLAHRARCAACAAFENRVVHFDRVLRRAVRVGAPGRLAPRILLRQSFRVRTTRAWAALAAAAAIVLLVAGAVPSLLRASHDHALAHEIVEMVRSTPYTLAPGPPLASDAVRAAIGPAGVAVDGSLGNVRFAGRCRIAGGLAAHLVIEGDHAPVTMFFVPKQRIAYATSIRDPHLDGLLIPDGEGFIAVVGASGEPLGLYAQRARATVRWAG